MTVAINIMHGYGLNNKVHCTTGVITLNVHFIRVDIPRFLHHKQGDITAKQSDDVIILASIISGIIQYQLVTYATSLFVTICHLLVVRVLSYIK